MSFPESSLDTQLRSFALQQWTSDPFGLSRSNRGGWHSKYLQAQDVESLQNLCDRVLRATETFVETGTAVRTRGGSRKVHLAALWANVNRGGDGNVAHQHAGDGTGGESVPKVSGVYYPSQGKGDASCAAQLQFPSCDQGCAIDPQPGTLVLFPASSLHSVEACGDLEQPDEVGSVRVSFAFNLLVRDLSDLQAQAAAGDLSGIEPLLQQRGIDSQDALGFTALHHAAESGHLPMVDLLLAEGASTMISSGNGSLPLHLALASQNVAVAHRLLEAEPATAAQAGGAMGSMPVHSAAGHGNVDLLRHLLRLRADLHAKQTDGSTPLHCAVQNGHLEVARFILQRDGPTPQNPVTAVDVRGLQPAHEAARGGLLPILSELLLARAEPNAKDDEGHSLLYWAAFGGHTHILERLLQARAEIPESESPPADSGKRGEAMANYLAAALVGPLLSCRDILGCSLGEQ